MLRAKEEKYPCCFGCKLTISPVQSKLFLNSCVSEVGRVHMGQENQIVREDGVSMKKMRMSSRHDGVSFLVPSSPASLSPSLYAE